METKFAASRLRVPLATLFCCAARHVCLSHRIAWVASLFRWLPRLLAKGQYRLQRAIMASSGLQLPPPHNESAWSMRPLIRPCPARRFPPAGPTARSRASPGSHPPPPQPPPQLVQPSQPSPHAAPPPSHNPAVLAVRLPTPARTHRAPRTGLLARAPVPYRQALPSPHCGSRTTCPPIGCPSCCGRPTAGPTATATTRWAWSGTCGWIRTCRQVGAGSQWRKERVDQSAPKDW